MDLGLGDRVVVVTGGASGIGRACVAALGAEGAHVAVIDRDPYPPSPGAAAPPSVQADLTDEQQVEGAVAAILDRFGRIDSVIACAGISGPVGTRLDQVTSADWDRVLGVNVRGNFLLTKHTAHLLEASEVGTYVFLASDSAFVAFEGMGPYSASKGALVMLTKAVAVDFPAVRANAVCPGVVDTPMSRADLGRPDGFGDGGLPVMTPEHVARTVVFLSSPASAPVNATTVVVDFGVLARSALGALDFDPTSG